MKKRKGWLVIVLIFLIVFGFEFKDVTKEIFADYTNGSLDAEIKLEYDNLTEEEKEEYSLEEYSQLIKTNSMTFGMVIATFSAFFLTIIKYIFLWIILIGVYVGTGKYYKKKLSNNDFIENKEYYREILKQYSVDLLGFIDNVKFNYPNVLIGMLMQLKLKGIINIDNGKIYINNGINLDSLSNNERYLISKINNNKLVVNNISEYEDLVVNEGINKELLIKKEVTKEHLIREFAPSISIYLLVLIGYILFWNSDLASNGFNPGIDNYIVIMVIFFVLMAIVFLPPIFIMFYPFYLGIKINTYYLKIKDNPYFRTKNAEEINKKLEGLKSFLKDFSKLDEREAKEIMLWDEYLIYSVLFGHNSKIIDEYKDLIVIYSYQQNC